MKELKSEARLMTELLGMVKVYVIDDVEIDSQSETDAF
jgi:hypothetical protein